MYLSLYTANSAALYTVIHVQREWTSYAVIPVSLCYALRGVRASSREKNEHTKIDLGERAAINASLLSNFPLVLMLIVYNVMPGKRIIYNFEAFLIACHVISQLDEALIEWKWKIMTSSSAFIEWGNLKMMSFWLSRERWPFFLFPNPFFFSPRDGLVQKHFFFFFLLERRYSKKKVCQNAS